MKVEMRAIGRVKPYPGNAKLHSEEAVAKLAELIQRFGPLGPIVVDPQGVIIKGHRTLQAMKRLGMTEVPVHVKRGLTPSEVKAARLADNRSALDTLIDPDLTREEFQALAAEDFDLSFTAYDADEIAGFLNGAHGLKPGADPDDAPDLPKHPETKTGDLIQLGRHRLLCGDATDAGAWDKLLGGEQAAMVWTDPPYNVDYASKNEMLNDSHRQRRRHRRRAGNAAAGIVRSRVGSLCARGLVVCRGPSGPATDAVLLGAAEPQGLASYGHLGQGRVRARAL